MTKKVTEEVKVPTLTESLGKFLIKKAKDKSGKEIEILNEAAFKELGLALGKYSILVFQRDKLIVRLAETRMVPGNTAREMVKKLLGE